MGTWKQIQVNARLKSDYSGNNFYLRLNYQLLFPQRASRDWVSLSAMKTTRFSRRTALTAASLTAAGIAAAPAFAQDEPTSPLEIYNQDSGASLPFLHGVASGGPLPSSVVLWTRVTPDRDSLPGSGLGEPTRVDWEVSTSQEFGDIVARGTETTSPDSDHTIHAEPHDLSPATEYYYRFRVADGPHAGAESPVGRTKTAPAHGDSPDQLTFAVASCANYESGFFCAYRDMAERGWSGELDLVVFLGDYIYEYGTGEYVGKSGIARPHHPSWEITTLEDYRMRYGRYRTDAHLQAAHASAPWVVTWDDHESANNAWRDGAENHTDGFAEGQWASRRDQALQAYFEWMPLRKAGTSQEGHLYRSFQFGDLMELTLMDLRSYRDAETTAANFASSDRTMLGSEQFAWLTDVVETSPARWMVLGNSVMMSPMRLLTMPGNREAEEAIQAMKASRSGIALNSDQWDGYTHDRDKLLELLGKRGRHNFFVTGDIHSEWANSIYTGDKEVACEMVTTSISAPNVDEILTEATGIYHAEDNSTSQLVEGAIKDANPNVNHLDYDAHGYAVAQLRADDVEMRYYRVSDVEDPEASVSLHTTRTWRVDGGFDPSDGA